MNWLKWLDIGRLHVRIGALESQQKVQGVELHDLRRMTAEQRETINALVTEFNDLRNSMQREPEPEPTRMAARRRLGWGPFKSIMEGQGKQL